MAVVVDEQTEAPETDLAVGLPRPLRGDRWTWEDLDRLPDDGLRYEVLDGQLLVNAAPRPRHQDVVAELFRRLDDACPDDRRVYIGVALTAATGDGPVPDLLVVRPERVGERGVVGPELIVEVLSRSTRRTDLGRKRELFAELGVPSYWVVDVDVPWLLELRLTDDGTYAETRHDGPGPHRLGAPFDVEVRLG